MGFATNNGKKKLVSDINVTPLVDVMLVLLIIFMVTAPMMTQGLDVDLPQTTSKALRQDEDIHVVTIDEAGKIELDGTEMSQAVLFQQLDNLSPEQKSQPIYLKADRKVQYGAVVTLMADIKAAGFDKLGMVTKPAEDKK